MKRFFQFLAISLVIVAVAFSLFEFSNQYKINTLKSNISWNIVTKNCRDSVGFDKDEKGNIYIAYKTYIKCLEEDGRETSILEDENLNIENVLFYNDKLYFISNDEIKQYDMKSQELKTILKKIPSKGKYLDRNLIIRDSKLLLSIGAATNSGIASSEDAIDGYDIPYDVSPINITLKGVNYGKGKTGAFMPYGDTSAKGQKIEARSLGNASVIEIDLNNKNKISLYACGIRNIKGWDIDSSNNLIGIVGGMENTGDRPINRDFDYLYKLDKGTWYGWPDFSGGDPISSPRFKGDKVVSQVIENPPNKIVCAPLYQYDDVNIIKYLSIDKDGNVLDKDTKVYYNSKDNMIEALSPQFVVQRLLRLKSESTISGIKYINDSIYILDSGMGCIYQLQSDNMKDKFILPKYIWIFLMILGLSIVSIVIIRANKKIMRNKNN